jgi:peptide/nickel transport system ATP-binding protein
VTVQAQILDLLRDLQAETGMSIILITHDLGVVAEMADEVAVMYAGRVVERAPATEIFATRSIPTRSACSARSRASMRIASAARDRGRGAAALRAAQGLPLPPALPLRDRACLHEPPRALERSPGHSSPPASARRSRRWSSSHERTAARGRGPRQALPSRGCLLGAQVGTVRAVDGVSFSIARGETLALVGESGCGKSTTARLVLRLIEPTAGTIRFEGRGRRRRRELRALRRACRWSSRTPTPRSTRA